MYINVNLDAAVGVLTFLGIAFVTGLALIIILHAFKTRERARARTASLTPLTLISGHLLVLPAFSPVSGEKVLTVGVEGHLCELDRHPAYSITNDTGTKTTGLPPREVAAKGISYVVATGSRFDEYAAKTFRYV